MKHLFLLLFLTIALQLCFNGCKKDDTTINAITNNWPTLPVNPVPADSSTGINDSSDVWLSWQSSDPDVNDTLKFDVYVGSSLPLGGVPIAANLLDPQYNLGMLPFPGSTYYWKIIAKDNHGASTTGETWQFTIRTRP